MFPHRLPQCHPVKTHPINPMKQKSRYPTYFFFLISGTFYLTFTKPIAFVGISMLLWAAQRGK